MLMYISESNLYAIACNYKEDIKNPKFSLRKQLFAFLNSMNESKKRSLTLTPSSGIQMVGKKRILEDGSPHKSKNAFGNSDVEDWQKQFLLQSREVRRLQKINEFLELERDCGA